MLVLLGSDVLETKDDPLRPGQFRCVRTESTTLGSAEGCDYRVHNVDEVWVPHDPEAEWLLRRDHGRIEWLTCEKPESDTLPRRFQEEYRAQYGTFVPEPPGWYNLTLEFLASLPRDPKALYELVAEEYAGSADPAKATFQHFTHVLLTGAAMPADLLAAMYRAMTHLPGVEITEEFANADGRTGTAIGLSMGSRKAVREDLVIDPATGRLIGRRSLAPNGTVAGTDVITTRITDELGG